MDVPYDLTSYVRVLKMATTPTTEEFTQVAKIAAGRPRASRLGACTTSDGESSDGRRESLETVATVT